MRRASEGLLPQSTSPQLNFPFILNPITSVHWCKYSAYLVSPIQHPQSPYPPLPSPAIPLFSLKKVSCDSYCNCIYLSKFVIYASMLLFFLFYYYFLICVFICFKLVKPPVSLACPRLSNSQRASEQANWKKKKKKTRGLIERSIVPSRRRSPSTIESLEQATFGQLSVIKVGEVIALFFSISRFVANEVSRS